jgi:hypothetical protein
VGRNLHKVLAVEAVRVEQVCRDTKGRRQTPILT